VSGTADTVPIPGLPSFGEALRTLGFASDVDFINEPLPRHRAFWTGAINREIAAAHGRFMELRERVLYLAYEMGLAEHAKRRPQEAERRAAFDNFYDELRATARRRVQAQPAREELDDEDQKQDGNSLGE